MAARRFSLLALTLAALLPGGAVAAQSEPTRVTTKQAMAVSCPSETLCVAVAVDPQASRSDVVVFDPGTPASAKTTPLKSVASAPCPGGPVCYSPTDLSSVSDV